MGQPTMRRRCFLSAAAWLAAGNARAAIFHPSAAASRRLKLFNAHTRERFNGPYHDGGGVIPSAAAELCDFLRDFHSGVKVAMDMRVIDFLWGILDAVAADTATILSAYRTPETNAVLARTMFGVAEHSQHMYARAIDFTIGSALPEAMAAARSMRRGGVGWYPRSHFIHIDTGPVRNWNLSDTNLQLLLARTDSRAEKALPNARRTPPASPDHREASDDRGKTVSQYGRSGAGDASIRPSQYNNSSRGPQVRPSQYGGAL